MARPKTYLPPKPGKDNLLIHQGSKPEPATISEAMKDIHRAGAYSGFLGGNIIRKPDYVVAEQLSESEKVQRKLLQQMLGRIIEPNNLSARSTPAMDARSLVGKLARSTLDDLFKLIPERIKVMPVEELKVYTFTDEDKTEIQELYKDRSP